MNLINNFSRYLILGDNAFGEILLLLLLIYAIIRIVLFYGKKVFLVKSSKEQINFTKMFVANVSIIIPLYLISISTNYLVDYVNKSTNSVAVSEASLSLMSLDKSLFGVYLPFWFHDVRNSSKPFWDFISPLILWVYTSLSYTLVTSWIISLYMNTRNFYKMTVSWILVVIISLPAWYLIPAISPQELFIDDKLHIVFPEYVKTLLGYFNPNSNMQAFINVYRIIWHSGLDGVFYITTFPSMHVAWATLLMYYMYKNSKYFAIFFVPYWILTCISTVYTLQHYAVDVPAGILVAILCILFCQKFLHKVPPVINSIGEFFKADIYWIYLKLDGLVTAFLNNTIYKK